MGFAINMAANAHENGFIIKRTRPDFEIEDVNGDDWNNANEVTIDRYWNGSIAEGGRQFQARSLWSETAFYIRFEANQTEPLVISDHPIIDSKTMNLWERDVCEIFIAPDRKEPRKYFEFEAAPTGEWIDLAIDLTSGERVTDWEYHSAMETAARIDEQIVTMAMKMPWDAFGAKPNGGDIWLGNIFRCVGKGPDRGYLTWQPTFTAEPSFHEPEKFGEFRFEN